MYTAIKPDSMVHRYIRASVRAEIDLCYDCGTCLTECPVNRMTDRLRPRELVRMAKFGLFEELMRRSELWYCLSCSRCSHVCPMTVKPATLVAHLRFEALRSHIMTCELASRIEEVHRQLHRVRRHLAELCLKGQSVPDLALEWDHLSKAQWKEEAQTSPLPVSSVDSRAFRRTMREYMGFTTDLDVCLTCRECTNACPVSREPALFDPLRIYRQITFGLRDELLSSPAPWLCLACEKCTRNCIQKVKGHLVIRRLRQLAREEGYVTVEFLRYWPIVQKHAYERFLEEIDILIH